MAFDDYSKEEVAEENMTMQERKVKDLDKLVERIERDQIEKKLDLTVEDADIL